MSAVHNAEQIAHSRQEEQATHLAIHGQQRVTRKTAAKLRMRREDWSGDERWETRALRLMYPAKTFAVESINNHSALAEVIAAAEDADALEDADRLPSAVDDVKEAEEGNSDENDVDGISEKEEDEGSDENEEARDSKFDWALKMSASGVHNHHLTKELWESFAENRTVKDPRLTKYVEVLHKAGTNVKEILQYLRERTGNFDLFLVWFQV
ncbi:hypothetical protein GN958_ATG08534 [Phytophthora infestans]|uniref:Uncharacterized protein n=1 Tax=Phytophthora infestans TaxID=4787 RepID=A0A8S9UW49_PHYIN|nr:hypothetical protein GN958_ATG08534 [Phytophthora infestans]